MKHTITYLKHQIEASSGSPKTATLYRLGKLAHPEATQILLDLLDETGMTHDNIQYILAALRYTGDPRANRILLHYFHNGFETSTVVINSLGHLKVREAVPQLIELLDNQYTNKLSQYDTISLRFRVVIALGNIGDERALPILKHLLNADKTTLRFALSDVPTQAPLCEYAYNALIKIGTPEALKIASGWHTLYEQQLQIEADTLQKRVQRDQNFIDLQGDLLRLKHHALPVLRAMSKPQLRQYPDITYNVLKEFAKQEERFTVTAYQAIRDFIIDVLQHNDYHLTLEQGLLLLDHYDDPRAIGFALTIFKKPDYDPNRHGDPLALLTKKHIREAVPIIAEKIEQGGVTERYINSLGVIGGDEAEAIVIAHLDSEDGQIKVSAIYALADLARESDSALEKISQLIDSHDYSISQQAIIRMDRVGKRGIFILLNLLRSYDKWSASRALATLARVGDERVIPHLLALLSDDNYVYLHQDIITTLEKLGGEQAYEIVNLWHETNSEI